MREPRFLEHDWYPSPVPANVVLGARSWLYSSWAFVHYESSQSEGVVIGDDSGVYIGSRFDIGPAGQVHIGRFCTIAGPIFSTNHRITIGDHTFISWHVIIADSPRAVPPPDRQSRLGDGDVGSDLTIGPDCWIGARTVILGPATVGQGAIIGAATVVTGDIPAYAVVAGDPARIVGFSPPAMQAG